MITKTGPSLQRSSHSVEVKLANPNSASWKLQLAEAIRDPEELIKILALPVELLEPARQAARRFPLKVTQAFLSRMQPGKPDDPLLLQVLPLGQESIFKDWGESDPVGDQHAMASPGLLHKYHGRVLLVSTAACAIHCRYCFRQHFPYQAANPLGTQWPASLAYLKAHPEINEVILSGGDPLSLDDEKLANIIRQLENLPHLTTLRIHSRLPVVLPSRITPGLGQILMSTRLNVVLVLHINHPQEIDESVTTCLEPLRSSAVTLLNQAVLLRGINDDASTLAELSESLFRIGVLPYYLHQLDKVAGAAHFEVPEQQGHELIKALQARLPGYLVPRYVREIAGQANKIPLTLA